MAPIMAEKAVTKPVVIILDLAKGYGWKPGSYGYEMVAEVRKLKDAAHAAGVQVIHVNSMRRETDDLPSPSDLLPGTENIEVIPELQPLDKDILIFKRYLSGFSYNDLDYTLRTMGADAVIIAGASVDNTVLWTAADARQHHYHVVLVDECCICHREKEPPGAKEAAFRIAKSVLKAEILSLNDTIAKYLKAR